MANVKYIKLFLFIFLATSCIKKTPHPSHTYPPFKLITSFSKKIQPETGLLLTCYGINNFLPKNYQYINRIGNFSVSYKLRKTKSDNISIAEARNLLVYLSENFLKEINSNNEVIPDPDTYPLTSDSVKISIRFKDENDIDLGQGVAFVYFSRGKIEYQGYKISEYRDRYPAVGKHHTIHEESYEDALEIVKKQGTLQLFEPA